MTLPELLKTTVDMKASDLHLTVSSPPQVRVDGKLQRLPQPDLTPADTKQLAYSVLTDSQKKRFEETMELDCSFGLRGLARFRCNVFSQRGSVAAVYRLIPERIRAFEELGLPPIIAKFAEAPRGLVLVTGPTGSGKSTTLDAIVAWHNENTNAHIVVIASPLEYVHRSKKCFIRQREVGRDVRSFHDGVVQALRQDLDIMVIGEMRDAATILAALEVTGRDATNFQGKGQWSIDIVDSQMFKDDNLAFEVASRATPLGTLATFSDPTTFGTGVTQRFIFNSQQLALVEKQLEPGKLTIRFRGPTGTENNLFGWNAATGPGDSGAMVVNDAGEIIGVHTQGWSDQQSAARLSAERPINRAYNLIKKAQASGCSGGLPLVRSVTLVTFVISTVVPANTCTVPVTLTKFPTSWFNQTKHRVTEQPVRGTACSIFTRTSSMTSKIERPRWLCGSRRATMSPVFCAVANSVGTIMAPMQVPEPL